jgi:hypothetical protein
VGSLVTYADLTSPAPTDATQTMAQMAVTRMQSTTAPMPPSPLPRDTSAQIMAVASWVAAGYPMGSCGGSDAGADAAPPPPDPTFTGPSVCASGQSYQPSPTGDVNANMDPGQACIQCHAKNQPDAPLFTVAGTVFPTGHVPDNCLPTSAQSADLTQAQVVITDKNNQTLTLSVNSNGNFYSLQTVAFPFTAKVVYQGRTRAMATPQSTGDCNTCHTNAGSNNAPGRIALP